MKSKKYDILDITFVPGDDVEPSILEWDIRIYYPDAFDCRILNFNPELPADQILKGCSVEIRTPEGYTTATEDQTEVALSTLEEALASVSLTEQLKYLL